MSHFKTRALKHTSTEMSLHVLAYNVTWMISISAKWRRSLEQQKDVGPLLFKLNHYFHGHIELTTMNAVDCGFEPW